ncbi:MAG TPA: DUF4382 domain-containing protein [Chitinophagales bacterium]|nr:DUF4382 domain-containing protein [Chitinophagales bacterium]
MKNKLLLSALVVITVLLGACKKDEKGTSTLSIRMTDDPANYDAVYIDIEGVEITGEGGGVTVLNVNAGIYNLLDFANGVDTLIATGNLNAGTISQIRLILGENNSVVVDNLTYPLSTPSAPESGLKLQVHDEFVAGIAYAILLDFDANESIVQQGNGSYQLKPVIRVVDVAISGSIKGAIIPAGINCSVSASGNGFTYTTYCDADGNFLLQGIPPGAYQITFTPELPFLPITLDNVNVTVGAVTDLGVISF